MATISEELEKILAGEVTQKEIHSRPSFAKSDIRSVIRIERALKYLAERLDNLEGETGVFRKLYR